MALTNYPVGHPLAVKLWARRLWAEALPATWFGKSGFISEGTNSIVQELKETKKGPGDSVTFGLRAQLSGDGTLGDDTLEGNEEALTTWDDSFVINQLRHAVRSKGKMSEQRVPFSVREEAKDGLRDWFAGRFDLALINQLAGVSRVTDLRYTGGNVVVEPDANHWVPANPGAANEAALTSAHVFSLAMVDRAVARAKMMSPLMRPVRMNGKEYFACIISPLQTAQLRMSAGSQWQDIQKAAIQGGQISNNPIFTGALGEYNGVLFHESQRIPTGVQNGVELPNVRRAVLCGAQAGVIGYGRDTDSGGDGFGWAEESFDYGNQLGVSVNSIFGIHKSRFNGQDFGTMVLSSYSPAVT